MFVPITVSILYGKHFGKQNDYFIFISVLQKNYLFPIFKFMWKSLWTINSNQGILYPTTICWVEALGGCWWYPMMCEIYSPNQFKLKMVAGDSMLVWRKLYFPTHFKIWNIAGDIQCHCDLNNLPPPTLNY